MLSCFSTDSMGNSWSLVRIHFASDWPFLMMRELFLTQDRTSLIYSVHCFYHLDIGFRGFPLSLSKCCHSHQIIFFKLYNSAVIQKIKVHGPQLKLMFVIILLTSLISRYPNQKDELIEAEEPFNKKCSFCPVTFNFCLLI